MKCDELKRYDIETDHGDTYEGVVVPDGFYMIADEVDDIIAEFNQKLSEKDKEINKLTHALWLARAEMARTSAWVFWNRKDDYNYNKWKKVEFKCRVKAEEYK